MLYNFVFCLNSLNYVGTEIQLIVFYFCCGTDRQTNSNYVKLKVVLLKNIIIIIYCSWQSHTSHKDTLIDIIHI